jgi:alpha-glucosidase (family GH31 glycosyl hydrolase)
MRSLRPLPLLDLLFQINLSLLTAKGAHFYFEKAELEISILAPDLVRVDWFPGIPPVPYAISKQDWQEVETVLEETAEGWTVSSKPPAEQASTALKVIISVDGSLKFYDSTGQTLREELPPQRSRQGWTHQARLREEEHIYGLGERAAPLNLRAAREMTEKGEVTDQVKNVPDVELRCGWHVWTGRRSNVYLYSRAVSTDTLLRGEAKSP